MSERLILIVEDDQNAIESWKRDIQEFNATGSKLITFVPYFARSKRSALRILDRFRVNCAIIDLRLPDEDQEENLIAKEPLGNNVLETILLETGVPAVLYSGYLPEASDAVIKSRIHRIQKSGGGAMEALSWLSGHEALMSAMEETRKSIAQQTGPLFSKYIWPRWEDEWKNMGVPGVLPGVLTRQTVSHVAEMLTLPPQLCHPAEYYLIPPILDRLSTGDLVKINGNVCVIVTPRCNMARAAYPDNIMLAHCKSMETRWMNLRERFNGGVDKKESASKELSNLAHQNVDISMHFLAPCGTEGPWMVEFKEIFTVPSSKAQTLFDNRFASIAPQFVPNFVQRYAAYLGRVGQPDLDCAPLRAQICK